MFYSEKEARLLVIEAAKRLLHAGLVARTWGNLSARISDTQFVITPSGLSYEIMEPKDLVKVNISDCSYEGSLKPSSEKGIHADAYRLRPEAAFVIHTHQEAASIYGIAGKALSDMDSRQLGQFVPCAAYGMPSTNTLRNAVADVLQKYLQANAVFMKYHGALCIGKDCEDAFSTASELEKVCRDRIADAMKVPESTLTSPEDLGRSVRRRNMFCLKLHGIKKIYHLNNLPKNAPLAVRIHASIYRHTNARFILWKSSDAIRSISESGKCLSPYLEDLIQIAGVTIRCASHPDPSEITKKLRGRNAVLIRDNGVLCTGKTQDDVTAVGILTEKGCKAALFAKSRTDCQPVGSVDALIQRIVYVRKYARKKEART